jgi:hypothetical protein
MQLDLRRLARLIALQEPRMDGAALSLAGQIGSMALAMVVGRFLIESTWVILLVSFLGGGRDGRASSVRRAGRVYLPVLHAADLLRGCRRA